MSALHRPHRAPPTAPHRRRRNLPRLRAGIYLLPSLFTLGNIFLGFWAIVRGLRLDFQSAALMIFAAGVVDALDGRIARLTGTESAFGKEFDSLADVITFGCAPALLAYQWGLRDFGRVGWLVPCFFLVCTATRLARFNVQASVGDKRYFAGLPSPAAAGAIVSLLYLVPEPQALGRWLMIVMLAALAAAGSLMISTIRYPSFKEVDLRRRRSYRLLAPISALLLVVAYHPPAFFLSVAVVYACYGPLAWLGGRLRRLRPAAAESEPEPPAS